MVGSVAIAVRGEPMAPEEMRDLMRTTGTPQPAGDSNLIGPQPNVRRMIRYGVFP